MIDKAHLWTASPLSRRRFFTVSSGFLAAGALTACGSNNGRTSDSSAGAPASGGGVASGVPTSVAGSSSQASSSQASSSQASSVAPSSSGSAAAAGKPTLSQWYHQYGEAGTQQAVERYAASYPAAKVNVQWVPGDYDTKVASSLLTNSGPDVFEAGNGPNIDQIQGGQVVSLDGILDGAAQDFTQSLIQRMTYKGKLYAVPQVIDMQLLVYRKSMLQGRGRHTATDFRRAGFGGEEVDQLRRQGIVSR